MDSCTCHRYVHQRWQVRQVKQVKISLSCHLRSYTLLIHSHTHTSTHTLTPSSRHPSSTMSSPQRSQSQQPQTASPSVTLKPRADSNSFQTTAFPAYAPTSTPTARDHLPFSFGAEFELIVRPKDGLVPDFEASIRERRNFHCSVMKRLARLLSDTGMPADVYDPNEDGKPDYSKWNVMLDGSLSKKHMCDGFCKTALLCDIVSCVS